MPSEEEPYIKPPMKPEEFNTIAIVVFYILLYIIPTIILAIFHAGAWEYVTALTIFMLGGMTFWHAGMALRD